jgi:putative ABC transport system substrate-binding protein
MNLITRRRFATAFGSAAAWPLAARAQQPAMRVVGYLSVGSPPSDYIGALRKGMAEQGYLEGSNFVFEPRKTDDYDRLPALAAELVARRVDVMFTHGNFNAAQAAKAATSAIPIVFTVGVDPVLRGLVASLNRPGGNATGVTFLSEEMDPKRLELLRELVPQASTIGFLANPTNAATELVSRRLLASARSVGQRLMVVNATNPAEIETAFSTFARERVGGLLIEPEQLFVTRRSQIIVLAVRYAIPAVYFDPEFARAGGLMSYSDDRAESFRQAGHYIGRIFKGEKPAELPILQPTKFTFAINLSTAKALGLEFPSSFQLRADEVIQ